MKTLLLADDSVTIQRVIELTFAHEDVRVVSMGDGRRALQWMEHDAPDIVLADVEVPEVDGYAIAAFVRQSARLRDVPVLLLAGAFEPIDHDRVQALGCAGVLVKPFEPQQLVSRVKTLLQEHDHAAAAARAAAAAAAVPAAIPAPAASANVTPFPGAARGVAPVPLAPPEPAAPLPIASGVPEPLEPPSRPVWETSHATLPIERRDGPIAPRVSLANAFSALLAAEQSLQPAPIPAPPPVFAPAAPAPPVVSDAAIEEAVRRVLASMTEDQVRRIVAETAERLVREEIERIKARPE
ncbi:MAG: response regulator [Acidobacteria bacterium]|nr:response regulator [Acidobacteriota bacterium]